MEVIGGFEKSSFQGSCGDNSLIGMASSSENGKKEWEAADTASSFEYA